MFDKILIANRGEIACRVAATARRLGVRTVAVYSQADAASAHVAACDEAVPIGEAAPQASYLCMQRILAAARACGAQAIHPGYGFLSENADFAQACADSGIVFIGPPPAAIRAMGLKAQAKQLMARCGVPVVPGYHGQAQDAARLQEEAARIGWPLLIKASAGGGGRGMRIVQRGADFAAALQSCQREAAASFGNAAVLLEKYVQRPRHIEVQIFADSHGQCVHLFERDCSVQRRHQKVLEEAPAPGLDDALRAQMGQAAVAAARAVAYVGAGTVEFIVGQDEDEDKGGMRFYFMEMNTRLQVEHPVTEAVTGQDLVAWQLRVAAGEKLPLRQQDLRMRGHAIEARICAENPARDFLPASGQIAVWRAPPCTPFAPARVRLDAGVRAGDHVSAHYDSLLAKLIVHGENRQQALALLDAALAQTHIVGLANNVAFLRRAASSASFSAARLDTALIAREAAWLFQQPPGLPAQCAAACVVAHILQAERAQAGSDPFSRRDGWRMHGASLRHWRFVPGGGDAGAEIRACLHYLPGGALRLAVGAMQEAHTLHWQADTTDAGALQVEWGARHLRAHVYRHAGQWHVFSAQGTAVLHLPAAASGTLPAHAPGAQPLAPMPGKIIAFAVQKGEHVRRGQTLALMEAMKMEHTIVAAHDGVVTDVLYRAGEQVGEGAQLLGIQAEVPENNDKDSL